MAQEQRTLTAYLADGFVPDPAATPAEIVAALVTHCDERLAKNRPSGYGMGHMTLTFTNVETNSSETVIFVPPSNFKQRESRPVAIDGMYSPAFRHPETPIYRDDK